MTVSGTRAVAFLVRVTPGNGDWMVTVDEPGGGPEYAKALAPTLDQALAMALPYMASVCDGPFNGLMDKLREAAQ